MNNYKTKRWNQSGVSICLKTVSNKLCYLNYPFSIYIEAWSQVNSVKTELILDLLLYKRNMGLVSKNNFIFAFFFTSFLLKTGLLLRQYQYKEVILFVCFRFCFLYLFTVIIIRSEFLPGTFKFDYFIVCYPKTT